MKFELMDNGVAKISLDNGKVNPITKVLAESLIEALERAESEAKAVVICGNPGIFSAGFDLKVVAQGMDVANEMFLAGFSLAEKMYRHPQPLVIACEGHAIGMGVFMLLAADYRIGAQGNFSLKLPETEIGMRFAPILKILAKTHIDPRHHSQAIIQSRGYDPETAAKIGMLDETVEAEKVIERAIQKAVELGALPAAQYKENKLYMRADEITLMSQTRGF
ncbi:crotonase/enoyl-CoA hydratase family protein [Flavobacterium sp. W21_SRS_FM6]|uniref:crotonase/enoyl-CoA hydratase family protein n=1 Tax=Flavobacterium sp. W21_SRS_FM6 TaxID=3240268 RepID=UPI003F8E53BF